MSPALQSLLAEIRSKQMAIAAQSATVNTAIATLQANLAALGEREREIRDLREKAHAMFHDEHLPAFDEVVDRKILSLLRLHA